MGVEALWTAKFGDMNNPNTWKNGGVVVLETGRLFGGDAGTYYLGEFRVDGDTFTAEFEVTVYDPRSVTVFGNVRTPVHVRATGSVDESRDIIHGSMQNTEVPELRIGILLEKRAMLPG